MVPPVYFPKVSDASFLLDSNEGIVAMYTVNGTTVNISQTINSPTSTSDSFGYSMAILGDTLIIGAPAGKQIAYYFVCFLCERYVLSATSGAGIVYVYTYSTTWSLKGSFHGNDTVTTAAYGTSVSVTQGWMAVGAPGDELNGQSVGLVYVYKTSTSSTTGYTLYKTLTPNSANTNGRFGGSVDISFDWLIAGDTTNGKHDSSTQVSFR
jgi:hypothetical protein